MVDTYAERSELGWTVRRRRMVEGVNLAKNKTTDGEVSPSVSLFCETSAQGGEFLKRFPSVPVPNQMESAIS